MAEEQVAAIESEKKELCKQIDILQTRETDNRKATEKELAALKSRVEVAEGARDDALRNIEQLDEQMQKVQKLREDGATDHERERLIVQESWRSKVVAVEQQTQQALREAQQQVAAITAERAGLANQLERVQASYTEVVQEMGAMSARMHELEFSSQGAERNVELEERLMEAERRLEEVGAARDQVTQKLDEVQTVHLAKERAHQIELADAVAAASAAAASSSAAIAATGGTEGRAKFEGPEIDQLQERVQNLHSQLEQLETRHSEDLKKQAQVYRDEAEYLKRKNDEKDRRLEVLICERNALRLESADRPKDEPRSSASAGGRRQRSASEEMLDLEEGSLHAGRGEGGGSVASGARVCLADGDRLLRHFSRILFMSPMTRRIFYGYVIVLHIWIWIVLHRAAALHAAHSPAK